MVEKKGKPSVQGNLVTVDALQKDHLTMIARENWAPTTRDRPPFNPDLVKELYIKELQRTHFNPKKIIMLEFSQYLECYLWPNYNAQTASIQHTMSVVIMINEKFRERIPAWQCFMKAPDHFIPFAHKVLELALDEKQLSMAEQCAILIFLVNAFNSVEVDIVREQLTRLVNINIWHNLLPSQRDDLLKKNKKLRKYWLAQEKMAANPPSEKEQQRIIFERTFLDKLIERFKRTLACVDDESIEIDVDQIRYCERFVELLIDLEALLPTRRFFNALLHSSHVVTHCVLSSLIRSEASSVFTKLVEMLKFYATFEINDITGEPLTIAEVEEKHTEHILQLQKAAFKFFRESMKEFYLLNVSTVDTRKSLLKQFGSMDKSELYRFAEFLHLVPEMVDDKKEQLLELYTNEHLIETLTFHCERRTNQLQQLNEMPLFPTEAVIWDENLVPYDHYSGEGVLALNKLNVQFLTLHDYLLRNFNLFQLESTYEVRQDLEDVLFRMKPWAHETNGSCVWGGWARMALAVDHFAIVEVAKPCIGEKSPAHVRADVSINVGKRIDIRQEWESLRKHDVCFLITCRPKAPVGTKFDPRKPFRDQIQVTYVRGCEIEGMLDQNGAVIEEYASYEKKPLVAGDVRRYRVSLDPNQYRMDMENTAEKGTEDVYYTFNLIVRRDPKTNNFKAVLGTMRELLNTECVVPDWLHNIILGYGEPDAAHYSKMANAISTLDFNDTFISWDHLKQSFDGYNVIPTEEEDKMVPPFKLRFKDLEKKQGEIVLDKVIEVSPIRRVPKTPYERKVNKNKIRFTPAQVEAIKAGMQPGLTMVVGPPGTGKTDVAVQIISNIYHNFPQQRTLIVTHSNQALNQLFEKIIALDVDERHLLRMGHGEEGLETEKDFSRYGRVNHVLKERLRLLGEVDRLRLAMGEVGDVGYTCENAGCFFRYSVCRQWDEYLERTSSETERGIVAKAFPFAGFFPDLDPLFMGDFEADKMVALSCWEHISHIFGQLEEFRAFELLRNGRDRTEYLLVKEAKIIAMTCTHAALRRNQLCQLGFRYDNILMEESAQILEVETFIPLLLQNSQDGRIRLKRWIMIGDHHQLPPVVQNVAFQKYSNMEQSLFSRFVRLGVPHVLLDRQGRARAEIASLYAWRYRALGNLPHVEALEQFKHANAGFLFTFQLIDVPDFNGQGETQPSPYFYQNLGEAEYAVALYTYMRVLGYPAEKISIITTYNGQAQLLRDVVERRCANNPLIGPPARISTVDKYQGQQNDYVILSLVRTNNIGHVRDVRRLVVALSRARLGLYVLARVSLFVNCFELTPAFSGLCRRPQKLLVIPNECYPTKRLAVAQHHKERVIRIEDTTHLCNFVHEFYMANVEQMRANYEAVVNEQIKAHQRLVVPAVDERMEVDMEKEAKEAEKKKKEEEAKKKKDEDNNEGDIVYEEMDFELLEHVPKY